MYDMKIVPADNDAAELQALTDELCCKLLVELKDVPLVDAQLTQLGVSKVKRPDEDIEEYQLWGDEHLCVTYTAYADAAAADQMKEAAFDFEDRR